MLSKLNRKTVVWRPMQTRNKTFYHLPCQQLKISKLLGPGQIDFFAQLKKELELQRWN
jgi:hypothetical protein